MRIPHNYTITAKATFDEPVDYRKTDINPLTTPEPIYSFIYQTKLVADTQAAAVLRFREDHLYPGAKSIKVLTVQREDVYDARRHRQACIAARIV